MDIEKFKKHINKGIKVKLKASDGTEDEFEFKPLNVEQFSTMMILGNKLNKNPDKENIKELMNLYVDIVKTSYPEIEQPIAEQFVVSNFTEFANLMVKLAPQNIDEKEAELLRKMQNRIKSEEKNGQNQG